MEHVYEEIQGWFDYQNVFDIFIKSSQENSKIVELGCWKGKSSSYLLTEALNSGKMLDISFIDTWKGSIEHLDPECEFHEPGLLNNPDHIWEIFNQNIAKINYPKNLFRRDTFDAVGYFEDASISFLFIDTAHEYEHVIKEIDAWYPKVKLGGIIAGHDYFTPGVNQAVNEFFELVPHPLISLNASWMAFKNF
jgi:predicted O-methyltransferase YrrM